MYDSKDMTFLGEAKRGGQCKGQGLPGVGVEGREEQAEDGGFSKQRNHSPDMVTMDVRRFMFVQTTGGAPRLESEPPCQPQLWDGDDVSMQAPWELTLRLVGRVIIGEAVPGACTGGRGKSLYLPLNFAANLELFF